MPPIPASSPALPEPNASGANPSNNTLFPENGALPSPSGSPGYQDLLQSHEGSGTVIRKSSTSSSLQALLDKAHYRTAKTHATNEAKLQDELAAAKKQPTEPEFREAMRLYYHDLHDRIVAIDPSCKDEADTNLTRSLQQMNQRRIRTTSADEVRADRAKHP